MSKVTGTQYACNAKKINEFQVAGAWRNVVVTDKHRVWRNGHGRLSEPSAFTYLNHVTLIPGYMAASMPTRQPSD